MASIEQQRHDLSHILATAVKELYPSVKLGIGPDIENGFYYDFDTETPFTPEDLKNIEKKMRHIQSQSIPFEKRMMKASEAISYLKKQGELFKAELAEDLQNEGETELSFYKNGNFEDMCRGPHGEHTNQCTKHFYLSSVAGAYFKGDSERKMLQRIYGIAFETKEELDAYKTMMEEAKKRDHRVLGKKLGLYTIDPDVGLGLPLWKPKGAMILHLLKRRMEDEQLKKGYIPVSTPHIGRKQLWETSGHWGFYNESMYPPLELGQTLADYQDKRTPKENEIYLLKPMNCPFHMKIFTDDEYSYRDLPVKFYEFGTVYRYEQKGELGGLTRVRGFTQDDAHIICTKEQLRSEFASVVDFVLFVLRDLFGFGISVKLSLRDPKNTEKYLGGDAMWNTSENTIQEILEEKGIPYEAETGEAAFYGPKADFKVKDSIGRLWQLSTIQFDFNLPERFDMYFTAENGEKERPFVIHRALLGSLERFMGIVIEHYAGAFPAWLAPLQVDILPVSDDHMPYAQTVLSHLEKNGVRARISDARFSLAKRIRNAEMQKTPFMIVLGDEERANNTVNFRSYALKTQETLSLEEVCGKIE